MSISKKFIVLSTFVTLLTFFGTSTALWAAVLSVPSQYTNIQAAIDAAELYGDTIEVADGTYTGPGNRGLVVNNKLITIKSQGGPENCIIDCENSGRGITFKELGVYFEFDGFTIKNASSGAIYCNTASPNIKNCIFSNNSNSYGGGIYCTLSSPIIQNCRFIENSVSSHGGGLHCENFSYPKVSNSSFMNNRADSCGGAIFCDTSSPSFKNCLFQGNVAKNGAAIYSNEGGSHPKIYNSSILLNSAALGSVLYLYGYHDYASATFKNCIIWGNTNFYSEIGSRYTALNITYSNIQTDYEGEGNISIDPKFISYFDPHLNPDSPCIDSGTPINLETDLDGNPRTQGRGIDMGAYEFVFENPLGDLNNDKKVDLNDAILIIQSIHGNAPDINVSNADFTNDNTVNIFDAVKLIQYIVKNIDAL